MKTVANVVEFHSACAKSNPVLPDFCHLTKWQRSIPGSEKLRKAKQGLKFNEQWELWGNQEGLLLPSSLENPIFWCLHTSTYSGAFKMTQIMNKHWCRDPFKNVKTVYHQHVVSKVRKLAETVFYVKLLSSDPFERLQLALIQLPPSMDYQRILDNVCVDSG